MGDKLVSGSYLRVLIDKIVNDDYLKGQNKTKLLIVILSFLLMALLTLFIDRFAGGRLSIIIIGMGTVSLLLMVPIIVLRQDELAVVFCVAVHVYADWYLGARFIGLGLLIALLLIRYLIQSPQQVWIFPRMKGLWLLLLLLAIFPALHAYTLQEGATYYLTIFFAAFLAFWLGNVLAQNIICVRRFFTFFAAFSTSLAMITLIQALTGKLLFYSPRYDQYMARVGDFVLFKGSSIHRIGGLLVNPDWNGAFLAIVVFLPLSLFFVSSTPRTKILYLIEVILIILALLSTYTTGAWIAVIVALFVFLILLGSVRSRLIFLSLIILGSAVALIFFHTQLIHQLQHATTVSDFMIRFTAWQTGVRVIQAFPLLGIGLGQHTYIHNTQAYHVISRYYRPLGAPQNSYLEIAAMGGIPLDIVFLILLSLAVWWTYHNWTQAESQTRALLAGGVAAVVSLSINSLGNQGWTAAVLTATGWLILGVVSSPLLAKQIQHSIVKTQTSIFP